jgi:hypothetical protein
MPVTYRLKRTGEIISCVTLALLRRKVDAAVWKDASNVRLLSYDEMVLTRYEVKLTVVSLDRRPSNQTVSKALATSGKTASVSLFLSTFLETPQGG